ncbi:FAD-binding protein [Nitriliruptoraceae bacterium ZYF776]|nr:FAD-binding protein [Profundirhabdus halotolerans]
MTRPGWLDELDAALPDGRLVVDRDVLTSHARDHAQFAPSGAAAAMVRAREVADVVTTLRIADAHRVPVVPRGAGTGLAGGANASDGCILLSVAAMDRILEVDPATRTARVEPGVLNAEVVAAAAAHGLTYAPDPASRAISSIGGNVATNAGGACCLKYGVTGDHVAGLRAVLPGGREITTGNLAQKDVAGLDLTRLLVGSEGTLAVVVEVTLRLLPAPAPPATLAAFFDDLEDAGRAVVAMTDHHDLAMVELMDRTTLRAVEDHARMDLDTTAGALVLVRADGRTAADEIAGCVTRCEEAGASFVVPATDPAEGELLMEARRLAYPALERSGATLLDDVGVPRPAIPALLREVEAIAERHQVLIGTFGHAGDGNFHPTIVFDPTDADATARARTAFDEVVRTALSLGGTISGEHGVGTLKRHHLAGQVGAAELELMRGIKAVFDPNGILNPGKVFT